MTTLQDRQQLIEILKELDNIHTSLSEVRSKLVEYDESDAHISFYSVNDILYRIESWRRELRHAINGLGE
jgi:hypothetical protein